MRQTRKIKQLNRIVQQIKAIQMNLESLSDSELAAQTDKFKERLSAGETLEDLLPEAFAAICEADRRVLGMMPYDVQILGGIVLHQGYLVEMNTGEGKTLAATMPLYLNALTGKSTILVTANEYLALRDAEEMGQVYRFMGLTVTAGVCAKSEEQFTNEEKKEIYIADIVYTTHGILGFDYLLNNLVIKASDRFMRELYYVVIDEADSVLLDAAQMPLVIAGSPRVQSNLYEQADFFVTTLVEGEDYETQEKKVWLTDKGIAYAERFFKIDNFYGEQYFEINRHVILALRAHVIFENRKDYMVSNNDELSLLDGESGRLLSGVKLRGGQHQALEVKEHLEPSVETRSIASITYQNLFLLFPKMAGMSGTVADAKDELLEVYHRHVFVLPTNRPVIRKDLPDYYSDNASSQLELALYKALMIHETGQPVLIVVSTIRETELVSDLLIKKEIPHNVLNANNAFWEAEIIREAGQRNAVTVSTAMAGRGTDIKLGEGVAELGGLAVIGIGRMTNIRQERQARGRSGRQGDPGFSQFFVSIQDEVVMNSGIPNIEKYANGQKRMSKHKLQKLVDGARELNEEYEVMSRKQAMNYDQVLQYQRKLMYEIRNRLLDGDNIGQEMFLDIAVKNISAFLSTYDKSEHKNFYRFILDNISHKLDKEGKTVVEADKKTMQTYLLMRVKESYKKQEMLLADQNYMNDFVRVAVLNAVDDAWIEQVDYLQQLQSAVVGRASAQRNPVYEYQRDALKSFQRMEQAIYGSIMRNVLLSNVYLDEKNRVHIVLP